AAPGRLHPGPGDGEAVGGQPQLRHQRDVLAVAVVVVDGYVTGVPAGRPARGVAEGVPDGRGPSVLPHRTLDLVRGGRGAPEEDGRKGSRGHRRCGVRHGSAPIGGRGGPTSQRTGKTGEEVGREGDGEGRGEGQGGERQGQGRGKGDE